MVMKQVPFKELTLGSKTIIDVEANTINRVLLLTKTIDGYTNYYWLDADNFHFGIPIPTLYELTEDEYTNYTK